MQLIAVFIENHKNIRNEVFNFSNNFYVEFYNNIFNIKKCSDEDIASHIINEYSMRIIIGNNGTGKTAVLEAITSKTKNCILFFYDLNTQKYVFYTENRKYDDKYKFHEISRFKPNIKNINYPYKIYAQTKQETKTIVNALLKLYTEYPQFKIIDYQENDENLSFDKLVIFPYEKSLTTGNLNTNNILKRIFYDTIKTTDDFYADKDILLLYFTVFFKKHQYSQKYKHNFTNDNLMGIITFDDLINFYFRCLGTNDDKKIIDLDNIIINTKKLFASMQIDIRIFFPNYRKLNIKLSFDRSFVNTKNIIKTFSKHISNIKDVNDYAKLFAENIPSWFFNEIFNFDLLKETKDGSYIFFSSLSTGEQEIILLFSSIFLQIPKASNRSFIIAVDEPTNSFHPEWQRKFIKNLNDFINNMPEEYKYINSDYGEQKRIQNVILTTHSPLLLTDVTEKDIIFLSRDTMTKLCKQDFDKESKFKTFGANIHSLLINSFFMERTIGSFAEQKISEIADCDINSIRCNEEKIAGYYNLLNLMDEDNLLRKLLEQKLQINKMKK